jgi:hypothetical protein
MTVRTISRLTWMFRLSNAALLEEFEAACAVYNEQRDRPGVMLRLELLGDEIARWEEAGLLTDDDWRTAQEAAVNAYNARPAFDRMRKR